MTRLPSPIVRVMGFSHQMSFPARAASTAMMPCQWGRGGDMYDIDVRVVDQVAVEVIGLERLAELLLAQFQGACQMVLIDVADGHQTTALVAGKVVARAADAADADDTFRKLVARGDMLRASQDAARHDRRSARPPAVLRKFLLLIPM